MVIIITFAIYIRAGGEIYKKRKQLKYFGSTTQDGPDPMTMDDPYATKTTEIRVTTEDASGVQAGIDLATLGRHGQEVPSEQANAQYSVTISSGSPAKRQSSIGFPPPVQSEVVGPKFPVARPTGKISRRRANYEANNAAWLYTKCALLFFTAILVTWIPSSANRVYSVIHTDEVSYVLEVMSALVLPLQGFWNAFIYVVTSWGACKMFVSDLVNRPIPTEGTRLPAEYTNRRSTMYKISSQPGGKNYESESTTELAASSRPGSNKSKLSV